MTYVYIVAFIEKGLVVKRDCRQGIGETFLFYPVELRSASTPARLELATWSIWSDVVSPAFGKRVDGKNSDDKVDHDTFTTALPTELPAGSRVGLEPTTNGVMKAFIEKGVRRQELCHFYIRRSGVDSNHINLVVTQAFAWRGCRYAICWRVRSTC